MFLWLFLSAVAATAAGPAPTPPSAAPAAPSSRSQAAPARPVFGPFWDALPGEWVGEGSGDPGAGTGHATFQFDLDRSILVRRSHADYPPRGDSPAVHHRDLVVVSPGVSPRDGAATYWDNEGHVIHYVASWSPDGHILTFLSAPAEPGPRFRLICTLTSPREMAVSFAIAPPGTETFREYVGGVLKRAEKR